MLKVWILVIFTSHGGEIEVAAYDSFEDCDEVSYYLNQDLGNGAKAECFEDD